MYQHKCFLQMCKHFYWNTNCIYMLHTVFIMNTDPLYKYNLCYENEIYVTLFGFCQAQKQFSLPFLMISGVPLYYRIDGIMVGLCNNVDIVNSPFAIACHISSLSVWQASYGSFDSLHPGQWSWNIVDMDQSLHVLQVFITPISGNSVSIIVMLQDTATCYSTFTL